MGRTQGGNNNAYCQDNPTSWVDWSLLQDPGWRSLTDLTARLLRLRREHPVLRRKAFFSGRPHGPDGLRDVTWFAGSGREMTDADWFAPGATLGMFLSGREIPQRDAKGEPVTDDSFLCVLHADHTPASFPLPGAPWAASWELLVDTSLEEQSADPGSRLPAGTRMVLPARSALVLRAVPV
jgi:glycogen operon protein